MSDTDDHEKTLVYLAQRHYENGVQKGYNSIDKFKDALLIRECFLGRYHQDTAYTYEWIGKCYGWQGNKDKAVVAHRAAYKIWKYLDIPDSTKEFENIVEKIYDDATKNEIKTYLHDLQDTTTQLKSALKINKFNEEGVNKYLSDLTTSLQHEIAGDVFRAEGKYKSALAQYKEALGLEKNVSGNDVTSAFLLRKMACTLGRKTDSSNDVDWIKVDRINAQWPTIPNYGLSQPIFAAIRKGDRFYQQLDFRQAKDEYHWALDMAREIDSERSLSKLSSKDK